MGKYVLMLKLAVVLIDNVVQQKRTLDKEFMVCFVFFVSFFSVFHFPVVSPSRSFVGVFVLICEVGKLD